jgi:cytochrome d ubiquinol oxidase subunit II
MDLNTLWFILIAFTFCAFFFLEGFDYGVAILMPFVAKGDVEKRSIINSIGPVWDGNEVWMILTAGAIFATFPNWYATLFSSAYILMFTILFALIIRNVSLEFRSKLESKTWRGFWDTAFFIGSLLPAFIWGLIITNFLIGIPLNDKSEFVGGFADLVKPLAIAGGLMGLILFTLQGSIFLLLKTEANLFEKVKKLSIKLSLTTFAFGIIFAGYLILQGNVFLKPLTGIAVIIALIALLFVNIFLFYQKYKYAIMASALCILTTITAVFSALFPRVMVSSLNSAFSLDIYNSSSSAYTLKVITICAVTLLPVIITYQAWTYWIFRKRVNSKNLEY